MEFLSRYEWDIVKDAFFRTLVNYSKDNKQ